MDRWKFVLPMLLALAACGSPPAGEEPPNARMLDGEWAVAFTLVSPLLPGHMPPQQTLRGRLALLRDASLTGQADLSGRPTHSGSYTTRFAPFGFEIDGGRAVPTLEARVTPGDSVAGTWLYDRDRGGIASGRFVMRRR